MVEKVNVHVRFFASLRERMGRAEESIEVVSGATVAQVWDQISGAEPLPENILIAINMEYVKPGATIHGDDEVAFFPPVTGG